MCCGKSPVEGGMATTSGDLSDDARFVVTTADGERRTFDRYADAVQFKKKVGGSLRTR